MSQINERTMPNVVWKRLWLSRLSWLASDCFECVYFDRLESQKLSMGNCFRHDRATEEDIRPFRRVHTDFESFSEQNVAGKQVRIHSRYVQYLSRVTRTRAPSWPSTVIQTLLTPTLWSFPFAVLTSTGLLRDL